jgi:hypothetical protein
MLPVNSFTSIALTPFLPLIVLAVSCNTSSPGIRRSTNARSWANEVTKCLSDGICLART